MAEGGGTVGRTVCRSRLPSGVKGMPPFPLQLPRTLALGSRPGPGPGGARCTGAQRFIQILGRLMPRFSHARQACKCVIALRVCDGQVLPTAAGAERRDMPMPARSGNGGGWWHSGKDCPPLPSPVGVKGMPPFPLRLPRTLALGSRRGPGPGGARCTGAQRFIQILGRLMPQFSHARQACQVCQCSQSPRWPGTTSCSGC